MTKTLSPTWYWCTEHLEWYEHWVRTIPPMADGRLHTATCYVLGLLACQGRPTTIKRCIRCNGVLDLWPLREAKWPSPTQRVLIGLLDSWLSLGHGYTLDEILPVLDSMEGRAAMEALCIRYRGMDLAEFAAGSVYR